MGRVESQTFSAFSGILWAKMAGPALSLPALIRPSLTNGPTSQREGYNASTMSRSILWFHEIDQAQAAHVGGKGLNLGLMTTADLPVPPGFVIPEGAYRAANGSIGGQLQQQILAA